MRNADTLVGVPTEFSPRADDPAWRAYADAWSAVHDPALLRRYADDIAVTHEINRAALWWNAMGQMTPDEWARWGDSPKTHLIGLLETSV